METKVKLPKEIELRQKWKRALVDLLEVGFICYRSSNGSARSTSDSLRVFVLCLC